jgi:hypothetical protein
MDICNEKGVSRVISIVPDPTKDIGLRLMSLFHFDGGVRVEMFASLPDAIGSLPGEFLGFASVAPLE